MDELNDLADEEPNGIYHIRIIFIVVNQIDPEVLAKFTTF